MSMFEIVITVVLLIIAMSLIGNIIEHMNQMSMVKRTLERQEDNDNDT